MASGQRTDSGLPAVDTARPTLGDTPEGRAKGPEEISEAIFEAVEANVANPAPEQSELPIVTGGGAEYSDGLQRREWPDEGGDLV